MKKLVLGASIAAALTVGGIAMAGDDPFLWLEETRGDQAMAWVKQQNAATTAALQGDPLYATLLQEATQILTASDRIPYGLVRGEHVYNFWQGRYDGVVNSDCHELFKRIRSFFNLQKYKYE